MDRAEVAERLKEVLVSELGLTPTDHRRRLEEDLEVDSLSVVGAAHGARRRVRCEVFPDEAENIHTVARAVDLVHPSSDRVIRQAAGVSSPDSDHPHRNGVGPFWDSPWPGSPAPVPSPSSTPQHRTRIAAEV